MTDIIESDKPSVGILTYFSGLGPGLSYHRTTLAWQREFLRRGYDATLYVRQQCRMDGGVDPAALRIEAVLPKVGLCEYKTYKDPRAPGHDAAVNSLVPAFERVLQKHDVVIAHDFMLLKMYSVLQDALRRAIQSTHDTGRRPHVLNVYHSTLPPGETPRDLDAPHEFPERLRWTPMDWSRPVSLSHAAAPDIANGLRIPLPSVGVLPNPFVIPSAEILARIGTRWMDADVLQVMPFCATRWEAKGVRTVVRVFGAMKSLGIRVFLVLVTANGRRGRGRDCVIQMEKLCEDHGLRAGEDVCITSSAGDEWASGVPHTVVDELQSYADMFIFPSMTEMCPNALGEAMRHGALLVLPDGVRVHQEICGPRAMYFKFPGVPGATHSHGEDVFFKCVAREVYAALRQSSTAMARIRARQRFNSARLFEEYMEPLLNTRIPRSYTEN